MPAYVRKHKGRKIQPQQETDDLVQSVHKSVLINLRDKDYAFDGPEDLVALAVKMAMCKLSHKWRKIKCDELHRGLVEELVRRRPAAEDPCARPEIEDLVRALLERLNDKDRLLLELYLNNLSTKEIAARLKTTENVVRVQRSRLFQRLRKEAGVDLLGA